MITFFQLVFSGLSLGAIYALIALGFVVIYRSSQVFNFAHGEFLTFSAYVMLALLNLKVPWGFALLGSMIATGLLAAAIERFVLRSLVGRPVFVTIILTIFLGYLIQAAIMLAWGTDTKEMATPWDVFGNFSFMKDELQIGYNEVATIVVGALALLSFFVIQRYTRLGIGMRSTSNDQEASLSLGIPVGKIFGATWFMAGVYAALAGLFLSLRPTPDFDTNLGYTALRAFPVVIIGGLDSALGAVIAGVLLGVLEVLTQGYLNDMLGPFGNNFHIVFPYIIMILFLIFRPYGIFGKKEVERV